MKKSFVIIFIILAFALPSKATILRIFTWEDNPPTLGRLEYGVGGVDKWNDPPQYAAQNTPTGYLEISNAHAREGSSSLKVNAWRESQTLHGKRHEIKPYSQLTNSTVICHQGEEFWFAYSVYLPAGYEVDSEAVNPDEIIFQVPPAVNDSGYSSIMLRIKVDQWNVFQCSKDTYDPGGTYDTYINQDIGSWSGDTGKWTDWAINWKMDYNSTGSGFVKIYKNGVLAYTDAAKPKRGNSYYGSNSYIKFGFYKSGWQRSDSEVGVTSRILYFDNVRIGDGNETLASMSPERIEPPAGNERIVLLDGVSVIKQPLGSPKNLRITEQPVQQF